MTALSYALVIFCVINIVARLTPVFGESTESTETSEESVMPVLVPTAPEGDVTSPAPAAPEAAETPAAPADAGETTCQTVSLPEGRFTLKRVTWANPSGMTIGSVTLDSAPIERLCRPDITFGIDGGQFWVQGCKGVFTVCPP